MNDNRMYECPVCGIEFRALGARDRHDILAHQTFRVGKGSKKIARTILYEI